MYNYSNLKEKFRIILCLIYIFKYHDQIIRKYGEMWHYGLIQEAFQRHAKIIRFKYQPNL